MKSKFEYNLVKAETYLCVPAVLETILKSENITHISQYEIAEFFGVNVSPDEEEGVPVKNTKIVSNSQEWGIKIPAEGLNAFFRSFKLPLHETYHSILKYEDWEFFDLLKANIERQCHLVSGFSYDFLFNNDDNLIGHVAIICELINEEIIMLDPGPKNFGIKKVDFYRLYKAIKIKRDGLWLIERNG